MEDKKHLETEGPCTESKLLALHTAVVCLARTLAESGVLNRDAFKAQLASGRQWLDRHDHPPGHNVQAFDEILAMLKDV